MSIFQREGTFRDFVMDHPITSSIIIINTLFLLWTFVLGGFTATNLISQGAITTDLVLSGQYYRIITAAFLHGSIMHFLGNMIIGLSFLGSATERLVGKYKYIMIYITAILVSSLFVVYIEVLFPSPANVIRYTVGASGGIFGLLGALFYVTIYRTDLISSNDVRTIRTLVGLNVIFTFLVPGISIPGHVGGFVSGFLISFLLIKRPVFKIISEKNDTIH